jgi:hypothetical protein
METFEDNLPLNGKVRFKGDGHVYVYRGFEGDNTRRCACVVEGEPWIIWLDRTALTPVAAE